MFPHLKVELGQHVLPVDGQLRRLAELRGHRVHELRYQTRAVVIGLTKVIGDHARSQRFHILGDDVMVRRVQRRDRVRSDATVRRRRRYFD